MSKPDDIWAKDCGCRNHTVPCWLWQDEMWKRKNRAIPYTIPAIFGKAQEEIARLREKGFQMQSRGIQRIPDEVVAKLLAEADALDALVAEDKKRLRAKLQHELDEVTREHDMAEGEKRRQLALRMNALTRRLANERL